MAQPWWRCLWVSCVRVNSTFRTILTSNPTGRLREMTSEDCVLSLGSSDPSYRTKQMVSDDALDPGSRVSRQGLSPLSGPKIVDKGTAADEKKPRNEVISITKNPNIDVKQLRGFTRWLVPEGSLMVFFLIKNRKNGGFNKTRSRDLLSRVARVLLQD